MRKLNMARLDEWRRARVSIEARIRFVPAPVSKTAVVEDCTQ